MHRSGSIGNQRLQKVRQWLERSLELNRRLCCNRRTGSAPNASSVCVDSCFAGPSSTISFTCDQRREMRRRNKRRGRQQTIAQLEGGEEAGGEEAGRERRIGA